MRTPKIANALSRAARRLFSATAPGWRRPDGTPTTIGDTLDAHRGRAPGFDMARLALSFGVLGFHSIITTYGQEAQDAVLLGPYKPIFLAILPMFFALSGFLIAGSLTRVKSLKVFIAHRVLRIVPALSCEVFLSALLLGPIVTAYALRAYFSDPEFLDYFFNIVGKIRYHLPGVFLETPLPRIVNFSLWTVPIEIQCYIGVSIMILLGFASNRKAMLAIFVGATALQASGEAHGLLAPDPKDIVSHFTLFSCFIGGVTLQLWRDRIPLTYACVALALVVMTVSFYTSAYYFLAPVCAAYLVACVGMISFPPIPVLSKGDYSYGVYLYGCPVQQTLMYCFPDHRNWAFNLGLAIPISLAIAYLSWNVIEKRALALKDQPTLQRALAFPLRARARGLIVAWRGRLLAAAGRDA